MTSMRSRAHLAWLGILLVLMQLLAPTISHAIVRASSTGTATIGWAAGWCSPQERVIASLAPGSRIAEPSVGIERSGPTDLVHHPLAACDYCGWPTSIGAIPTAAADGPTDWSIDQPVPATSDAPAPAWPWPDGHGARAPPTI